MDYDNWSRCSAKSVFQAHGIDGARKDEHSPPAQAPLCIGVLPETAGVPGWHVWVAGGGARHIGDNQGAVSRCKAFPRCVQNRWITLALLSKFMMRFATSSVAGSDQRAAVRAALPRRRLDSTLISSGPEGLLVQKLL
jgi:hypothetical protein